MRDDRDAADVRRVLEGDVSAFAAIVERWQGPLVNLAWRFCRDRAGAEDMAQEAFLRIYRNLARYREDAAFSTWLFAVATNLYRSQLRRRRPPTLPFDEAQATNRRLAHGAPLEAEDSREAVRRAVTTLPARYRDALVVFYFQEQDLAAAARTLGVPEGTLKARLHRGREMLRGRLSRMLSAGPRVEEA